MSDTSYTIEVPTKGYARGGFVFAANALAELRRVTPEGHQGLLYRGNDLRPVQTVTGTRAAN